MKQGMKYEDYNTPDNWIGGFYGLSIEYHPAGDRKRLNEALTTIFLR